MDRVLQQLLESNVLTADVKTKVAEAWDSKIAETRQELEEQTRQEFSKRYDADKSKLVEAMDKFLNESLTSEMAEFHTDRKRAAAELAETKSKLKETVRAQLASELKTLKEDQQAVQAERVKLSKAVMEAKKVYKAQMKEHALVLEQFVKSQLTDELTELNQDKNNLVNERKEIHAKLRESRKQYKAEFVDQLKMLKSFVNEALTEELTEFEQDKKILAEERVKFHTESKAQLAEAKRQFVKNAAKLVETTAHQTIKDEMTQFKDDLKEARQNNFGRKIFEAYAAEYMTSYLSEGSETRKLKGEMQNIISQLSEAKNVIANQKSLIGQAKRKAVIAEDRASRSSVINDLIAPLPREQKIIMTSLLENVKTERLNESFARYLPNVLNESTPKVESKKVLTETKTVTGNKVNRLSQAVDENNKATNGAELIALRKLAGLK